MNTPHLPRDLVMTDVAAYHLTEEEKQRLLDPAVGGVILFRRNFENVSQLKALAQEIKAVRTPELIIVVDHEGGRAQRFIDGFIHLPAMNVLGEIWDDEGQEVACTQVEQIGWVLATELSVCGIDLSFTPVLDLNWGQCAVIGNRSSHRDANIVTQLALALQKGLNKGGMKSCGKHSPGHGFVRGDSHRILPCDERSCETLEATDLVPLRALGQADMTAIIPVHIIYPQIDNQPTDFSGKWLKQILRQEIGFNSAVFSGDLTMKGACGIGGIKGRARLSFEAGYDIVLMYSHPDLVDELRDGFHSPANVDLAARWQHMANTLTVQEAADIMATEAFQAAQQATAKLTTPKDIAGGVKVDEAF